MVDEPVIIADGALRRPTTTSDQPGVSPGKTLVIAIQDAGNPNAGGGTAGNKFDIYLDTTNVKLYINKNGNPNGWKVI